MKWQGHIMMGRPDACRPLILRGCLYGLSQNWRTGEREPSYSRLVPQPNQIAKLGHVPFFSQETSTRGKERSLVISQSCPAPLIRFRVFDPLLLGPFPIKPKLALLSKNLKKAGQAPRHGPVSPRSTSMAYL